MRNFVLGARDLEVLAATIRTFIATGEPVGSRTISRLRDDGLSAATIRNIMADLEEAGYLEQPHTSAGRVPTEKAYRFYVEHLTQPAALQPGEEEMIRAEIRSGAGDGPEAILEHASHVLSLVTRNIGLVISATAADTVLQHIRFMQLGDQRVLVVLTPRGAPVRSRVVRAEQQFTQDELDRIANYLNHNFTGWRLELARSEILRRLEEERAMYDELLRHLGLLWKQGILDADAATGVYVEGTSHLMGRPELENPKLLRELLRTLEEKERLVALLTRYLQADASDVALVGKRPRVVIGLDVAPPMRDFVLIGALSCTAEGVAGRVAVLSPPRIEYERVISAVSSVARLVGEAIGQT
jgi:heat-inducible transcriptional repressor